MPATFDPEIAVGASLDFKVCGVDEVGRGPLAGPVVAAAAHIPAKYWQAEEVALIQDSKKLPLTKRLALSDWIKVHCEWSIAEASVAEIDEINILQASMLAMSRAVGELNCQFALVDGNRLPILSIPGAPLVKGDARSKSIAAASILAKVHRDDLMTKLDLEFPMYGWARNSGYPTAAHRQALVDHGPTCHHRVTFRGVKNVTVSP